ncbi:MAG: hypothetical protein DRI26_09015 [Chloroflexi bacterium]|nr:MAG: hypothetical protein DRI26_09015 [Chloroflexota bacterium]
MPLPGWKSVSLPAKMIEEIEWIIENRPELGYKTVGSFVTAAVRRMIEQYGPRLEHFNLNENGVMVLDRELKPPPGRILQVYFRPEGVWCEYCESDRCRHVEFALSLPKVQEILRKKGWKVGVS